VAGENAGRGSEARPLEQSRALADNRARRPAGRHPAPVDQSGLNRRHWSQTFVRERERLRTVTYFRQHCLGLGSGRMTQKPCRCSCSGHQRRMATPQWCTGADAHGTRVLNVPRLSMFTGSMTSVAGIDTRVIQNLSSRFSRENGREDSPMACPRMVQTGRAPRLWGRMCPLFGQGDVPSAEEAESGARPDPPRGAMRWWMTRTFAGLR